MKFTTEEIALCKAIAEKGLNKTAREIDEGDWYVEKDGLEPSLYVAGISGYDYDEDVFVWQISDCLEFLREKGWRSYQFTFNEKGEIRELSIVHIPFGFRTKHHVVINGETFLEACLKAVLAILEES